VFQAILVTGKRLNTSQSLFCLIWSFICQQLRHLSEIYSRNLQGNDLCMNALWWVSHLSSVNIFAQVASTFKGEQKFASGNELAPFSFGNMVYDNFFDGPISKSLGKLLTLWMLHLKLNRLNVSSNGTTFEFLLDQPTISYLVTNTKILNSKTSHK